MSCYRTHALMADRHYVENGNNTVRCADDKKKIIADNVNLLLTHTRSLNKLPIQYSLINTGLQPYYDI